MNQEQQLVKLICPCGNTEWNSSPDSEHFCRNCDQWLIFKNGKLVGSKSMDKLRRRYH